MIRSISLALLAVLASPLAAQDLFSPVIQVNSDAVTGFEIDQRARLLSLFGTPGDTTAQARTDLVDDRLKLQEMARRGLTMSEDDIARAIADFAARVARSEEELQAAAGSAGIEPETLRDYVIVGAAWRDYVRARYGSQVTVTDAEIDQRMAQEQTQGAGLDVLLSEIIFAVPPGQEANAQAIAENLTTLTSTAAFEAAARQVSQVPSRDRGGNLDWTPITNYPPQLQELLLGLSPGQTTPVLNLTGAVAVLQLRDVREGSVPDAQPTSIDYATVATTDATEAATIAAQVDTCDDLYGVMRSAPDRLVRTDAAPGAIPDPAATLLGGLDADEITWTPDGRQLVMLCARTYPLPEGAADREAVASLIRSEKLEGAAAVLIAELRAAARITGE